jgi:hypothetical protein
VNADAYAGMMPMTWSAAVVAGGSQVIEEHRPGDMKNCG